jgi:hypothetical protein
VRSEERARDLMYEVTASQIVKLRFDVEGGDRRWVGV